MLSASARFTQIASTITDRVAELLYAPVFVTDEKGVVITSSEPHQIGLPFGLEQREAGLTQYLRVPLCHETKTGEVIIGKPPRQERISLQLAQVLIELVINQAATVDRLPSQPDLKNQLISDLLHDQIEDEALMLSQAKRLGIDLSPPRAVILIDATDYIIGKPGGSEPMLSTLEQGRRAQLVIGSIVSFFHLPNDTICANLGQGEIAVLKASDTKNLDLWANRDDVVDGASSSWANLAALKRAADALLLRLRGDTGASIDIGIGRYHPGLFGLPRSYEDAKAALSLGSRFQGHNRIHCLGELGIAAFVGVADESTKVDLAKYLLSPLDHEAELIATLDVFFSENCCPSSAARRLSIHRNTLGYRLDKIASLTGLDPRKFDDAVQMRLSLLLRSLQSFQPDRLRPEKAA
ncbi:helix-turn-helix domain-containing protein [Oculatella sp. LEGE 06141]|uniref:PucR family transcriptional regulator n=1 Tax=Oculatella sp. LEGE 06141 TaxID=1828648 RepID=UPI00187F29B1|nr:helix-turn-helix domain-containing protein [Oculatella sp. LEGE 06141]MBE9180450.1 helix-turn-helix domain-containing protein [Oculatella sp. LEGE 06141]